MRIESFVPSEFLINPVVLESSQDIGRFVINTFNSLLYDGRVPNGRAATTQIDQASIYLNDALRSQHWRSAGLLYYYSLMNYVKAALIMTDSVGEDELKNAKFDHGLFIPRTNERQLSELDVVIKSPNDRSKVNLFTSLYRLMTGKDWPKRADYRIKVKDFLGYIYEIGDEVRVLGISPLVQNCYSIRYFDDGNYWFESLVPRSALAQYLEYVEDISHRVVGNKEIELYQSDAFQQKFNLSSNIFLSHALVSSKSLTEDAFPSIRGYQNRMTPYLDPLFTLDYHSPRWLLPEKTKAIDMPWRRALSNYLFAFCLADRLRYEQQLFDEKSADSFVAQTWCDQGPLAFLRSLLICVPRNAIILKLV